MTPTRAALLRTALFAVLAVLSIGPALSAFHLYANRYDWHYFESMGELSRRSILWFAQFPLWNPASCGGEVAFANPQSLDASPTFPLVLLFGTTEGYKLALGLYFFLAMDGAARLARHLGCSATGSTLAGLGFGLSGYLGMHYSTGHMTFTGVSLFPYLVLCFDRSLKDLAFCIPTGLFAAWIALLGGTFTPPMAAELLLFWAAARSLRDRSVQPLLRLLPCGAVALLIGAVRLLPVLQFVHDHPRPPYMRATDSSSPLQLLLDLAEWRGHGGLPGRKYYAHEYSAHIPWPVLPLAALGALLALVPRLAQPTGAADASAADASAAGAAWRRSSARLLVGLFVFGFVLAMGNFTFGLPGSRWALLSPWSALQKLPVLKDLRVPSRHLILIVLAAAPLGGLGWDVLARGLGRVFPRGRLVIAGLGVLCVLGAATDGAVQVSRLFRGIFDSPQPQPAGRPAFYHEKGGWQYMREVLFRGHGSLGCDEEAPLQRATVPLEEGPVPQERLRDPASGEVVRSQYSPNRREIEVELRAPALLIVNSNWNEHWQVAPAPARVVKQDGRLAVDLSGFAPGRHRVVLEYRPRSFGLGLLLTAISLPACALLFYRRRRRASADAVV